MDGGRRPHLLRPEGAPKRAVWERRERKVYQDRFSNKVLGQGYAGWSELNELIRQGEAHLKELAEALTKLGGRLDHHTTFSGTPPLA